MTNRDDNRNGHEVSPAEGRLIRLGTEPGDLVPLDGPSANAPARRGKSPGVSMMDTSAALGALTAALTTLSGQLERERVRTDTAEAALAEARAARKAAMEEAAALRQELRRRSAGLGRLGRLVKAWEGE